MLKFNYRIGAWMGARFWESRQFYSAYIALFISISNWITIQYKLVLESVPGLNGVFSNLWIFLSLALALFIIVSVLGGHYVHRKRQFRIEQALSVEENPYLYLAAPGKERDLIIPIMKLQLETLEDISNHIDSLSEEKKKQFKQYKDALDILSNGKPIGGFKNKKGI
jgi:F0F1-type ATP synthase membrane subunit a